LSVMLQVHPALVLHAFAGQLVYAAHCGELVMQANAVEQKVKQTNNQTICWA
jgi:hypothetical protein